MEIRFYLNIGYKEEKVTVLPIVFIIFMLLKTHKKFLNLVYSPDAKTDIDFLDGMRFDTSARGKQLRGRNFLKKLFY